MKRTYKILFTSTELIAGDMREVNRSSKWLTLEEAETSSLLIEPDAKIVKINR